MTKREYLNAILELCTDRQKEMFQRLYPDGVNIKQLSRATQQVEATLRDTDHKLEGSRMQNKALEAENEQLQKDARKAGTRISQLEKELLRAEHHIARLQGPEADENAETIRKLAFLDALEGAGVDNWDGYEYALEAMEG